MKKRDNPLDGIRKGQAAAAEARRELLVRQKANLSSGKKRQSSAKEKPKAMEDESAVFLDIDVEAALAAIGDLHFRMLDTQVGAPQRLNRPTMTILSEFLNALRSGQSTIVLQWPFGQRDISFLHPLAMLASMFAPKLNRTSSYEWCEPATSFRSLYFPWRGGATSATQRNLLVDRDNLIGLNKYHLTRHVISSAPRSELDGIHETIGHLGRLKHREETKTHLAHPTLAEMYPVFVADEGRSVPFDRPLGELFSRVRYGAALDQMTDHRDELSEPGSAPFGMFGVSPRVSPRTALSANAINRRNDYGCPPDLCILDLGPPAMSRLGPAWQDVLSEFLAEFGKRFPNLPVFASTQDSFVHQRVQRMLRDAKKSSAVRSAILLRASSDALTVDPLIEEVSEISPSFSTIAGPTADAVSALSKAARGSSDPNFAGLLRREMGSLRKAASLPCGLATAYDTLCEEIGQSAAETFLEYKSRGTLVAPLEDALASEIGGAERTRVAAAKEAVEKAFDVLEDETPIGSLLAELAENISRKASRSAIVFASSIELLLGQRRLVDGSEQGQKIQRRLDNEHLLLASAEDWNAKLEDICASKDRNTWKRLILVAPSLDFLSSILTKEWIPEELTILCERNFASRVANTYKRLASHPDLTGTGKPGERLARVAQSAKIELDARSVTSIELDLEPATHHSDASELIDLIDDETDEGTDVVLLTLASGRKLRGRPGSVVIAFNQDADINPFERSTIKDLKVGQPIVVPDGAFVAEAREILPIRVLAQSWVDIYHSTVEAQLTAVPGDTLSAKARHILSKIQKQGARTQSQAAVVGWLKVEEYKNLPPEERQPHAPQRRREFDAFMEVLGAPEALSDKMWTEGIHPLRIDRRRAGHRMAQAFVSVLVDPHGTASGLDKSIRDSIKTLRQKALDFIDQVVEVTSIGAGEDNE